MYFHLKAVSSLRHVLLHPQHASVAINAQETITHIFDICRQTCLQPEGFLPTRYLGDCSGGKPAAKKVNDTLWLRLRQAQQAVSCSPTAQASQVSGKWQSHHYVKQGMNQQREVRNIYDTFNQGPLQRFEGSKYLAEA